MVKVFVSLAYGRSFFDHSLFKAPYSNEDAQIYKKKTKTFIVC